MKSLACNRKGKFSLNNIHRLVAIGMKGMSLLLCVILMYINLYYMHYAVADKLIDFIPSVIYCSRVYMLFDILFVLLFFSIVTLGKRKYAYTCTYFLLLFWEFVNIIYSRFFYQYFSFSALGETDNFFGFWWLSYLREAFRWSDLVLVCSTVIFLCIVYFIKPLCALWNQRVCWWVVLPSIPLLLTLHIFVGLPLLYDEPFDPSSIKNYWQQNIGKKFADSFIYDQELTIFQYGLVRTQLYCNIYNYNSYRPLSEEEYAEINQLILERHGQLGELPEACCGNTKGKNVIFIIVESWLSVVQGKVVNGKEITPNLNRLAKSKGVYFNGNMKDNKTVGESSDAQLLYFTGLYPLRSRITVGEILNKKLIGLPLLLRKQGYSTHITIPTRKYFWHQFEANLVYGIDSCYSAIKGGWDNMTPDKDVFELAYTKQQQMHEPYFHVILTAAMHGPYMWTIPGVDLDDSIQSEEYSDEFVNYLQKCHYTDRELGAYINKLKRDGIYDDAIIVIAADHAPHAELLNTSPKNLGRERIPFMILNADIDIKETVNGTINQLDVFPSLVDILGLESPWHGLGHSIMRKASHSAVIDKETQQLSEKIIYGDFFRRAL